MKKVFGQHKPFFVFLFKFLMFYLLITMLYKFFLNSYSIERKEVDAITTHVANQTKNTFLFFGKDCKLFKHEFEASFKLLYKGKYVARIVEGCNAISVIILFASFVFAFSSNFKKALLFMLIGAMLIYVLNILRIVLLCVSLYYYPQFEHLLHGIVFPLVIYGVVFLLWIIWVTKFSGYGTRVDKK